MERINKAIDASITAAPMMNQIQYSVASSPEVPHPRRRLREVGAEGGIVRRPHFMVKYRT